MERKKSREIPLTNYFTILQIEYLSYHTRRKIYSREEDIKKFSDICVKKREKIESIALKQCLPNIFNSEDRKLAYIEKFINEWGLPNFDYRDDYQRTIKGHWDKIYFFPRECRVEVLVDVEHKDSVVIGEIVFMDYKTDLVTVICEGDKGKYQIKRYIDCIRRNLPEDFFEDFL